MIDNIKLECMGNYYPAPENITIYEPFNAFGNIFYPRYNREGNYSYHGALFDNLMVKIYRDKFTIENSLQKFYHKYNHSDFTFSEIKSTVNFIEETFKISSKQLYFRRIETGLNIEHPQSLKNLLVQFKLNDFENMRSGKTIYGRKCYMTEYSLKGYDKHTEMKLNNNSPFMGNCDNSILIPKTLNRFEVEYKKMRPLKGIVTTLSDLKNKRALLKLGNKIISYFDKIIMQKDYDYSVLTSRQRELVFAGSLAKFWEAEKKQMDTRKNKMKIYKNCIKMLDDNLNEDPKIELKNLMLENIHYLVSN